VAIKREGDYAVSYFLTPLETVARHATEMPDRFINAEGNGVTEEFIKYAKPLIGRVPEFARIHAPKVPKILCKD